ncbi:hypothetical protein RJ641_005219 [Dillenia turbinata]|uniref:Uncharacterized protein n=1 Tax=Dillenia turbinata TaxID=194707 RepID=A0AAN8VCE0_9MAGN
MSTKPEMANAVYSDGELVVIVPKGEGGVEDNAGGIWGEVYYGMCLYRSTKSQSAFRDGLLEAGVEPYNGFGLEHKIGTKIGGTTFDTYGRRYSAADLLSYDKAANIKVALHGTVERILVASASASASATSLSTKTAIEFVYRDQLRGFHHAIVNRNFRVIGMDAL